MDGAKLEQVAGAVCGMGSLEQAQGIEQVSTIVRMEQVTQSTAGVAEESPPRAGSVGPGRVDEETW